MPHVEVTPHYSPPWRSWFPVRTQQTHQVEFGSEEIITFDFKRSVVLSSCGSEARQIATLEPRRPGYGVGRIAEFKGRVVAPAFSIDIHWGFLQCIKVHVCYQTVAGEMEEFVAPFGFGSVDFAFGGVVSAHYHGGLDEGLRLWHAEGHEDMARVLGALVLCHILSNQNYG